MTDQTDPEVHTQQLCASEIYTQLKKPTKKHQKVPRILLTRLMS